MVHAGNVMTDADTLAAFGRLALDLARAGALPGLRAGVWTLGTSYPGAVSFGPLPRGLRWVVDADGTLYTLDDGTPRRLAFAYLVLGVVLSGAVGALIPSWDDSPAQHVAAWSAAAAIVSPLWLAARGGCWPRVPWGRPASPTLDALEAIADLVTTRSEARLADAARHAAVRRPPADRGRR